MRTQWDDRNVNVGISLSLPLFIALGHFLGWPWPSRKLDGFFALLVFAAVLVAYFLMFVIVSAPFQWAARRLFAAPNKKWHLVHGPEIPATKLPNIAPVHTT